MKARALLLVCVGLLVAADDPKEAVKKEVAKLQGTWEVSSLQYGGKDLSADGKLQFKLVFKGDQATIEGSDQVQKEYGKITFKLDPTTTPRLVDITVNAGVQKDTVLEGIYELKDDEFKICVPAVGKDRPGEFAAPGGSSNVLVVFKRVKP